MPTSYGPNTFYHPKTKWPLDKKTGMVRMPEFCRIGFMAFNMLVRYHQYMAWIPWPLLLDVGSYFEPCLLRRSDAGESSTG